MTGSIEISGVVKLIQVCVNKGQTVGSNRETCIRLIDSLSMAVELLQDIQSSDHLKTEEETRRLNHLLQKLQIATTASIRQFDECQSDALSKRIGNFLHSSSIKNKLRGLQQELQTIIATLSLVFQIGKSKNRNSASPQISLHEEDRMSSINGGSPSGYSWTETEQPPSLNLSNASAPLSYQSPIFPHHGASSLYPYSDLFEIILDEN